MVATVNSVDVESEARSPSAICGSRFTLRHSLFQSRNVRVFLGFDHESGRDVVVKLVALDAIHPAALMQTEYEAAYVQRLRSSWLAAVEYTGRENNDLALVYEYIHGTTLRERLQAGPLTVQETLVVGHALFSGLRDIHGQGILHRGIRPSNIIVNEGGPVSRVTILPVEPLGNHNLEDSTAREQWLQTALYLSPEQAGAIDHDMTEAADLYSAGVTLFHCLAGRPPFQGSALGTILFEHMTACVPELRSLGVGIPRALDEVIQRLLRKDPHDRYQTAEAVLADLDAIAAALEGGETEPALVIGAHDVRQTLTEPAFVARADELTALDEQLRLARQGLADLITVEGESGSGKTRLLTEMSHRAAGQGFWVLWGQGTSEVAREPFSLLKGVVDGFLAAANSDPEFAAEVRHRLGDHAPAVGAALPGLAAILGATEVYTMAPESTGEMRTLNALGHFFDALGTPQRPVLLVLDDCQWADELTYRLIRRWRPQHEGETEARHVVLVAAFRSEEVSDDHPLRRIPAGLCLQLKPFEPAQIQQLVESMAGPLPEVALTAITRLAEGSPFMASAVLRGFVESGTLMREGGCWRAEAAHLDSAQSSSRAADFLARRLEMLPDDTLRLLSTGAVLGREFELDIAAELSHEAPAVAIEALHVARHRRLVWLRPDGSMCVFVHDKIRSALLEMQTSENRRRLHLQAAQFLVRQSEARAGELAYHFDAAGDPTSALPYAMKAAEQSRAQYALEVAEQQYRIARRGVSSAPTEMRYRMAEALGEVLMLRGRYDEAGVMLEEAAALAEGTFAKAQIRGKQGELAFKRGDMEGAITGFETALRTMGRFVPRRWPLLVTLVLWETIIQFLHTCFPKAFVHRRKRLPNDFERLTLHLLSNLAHGCWYCRSVAHVMWAHLRNMNMAERYLPTLELAQAYAEHAPGLTLVGYLSRATTYVQKSLQIRREFGDLSGQGQSFHYYGVVFYAGSQYRQCIEKCREAIRLLERTGDYWQVHIARYQIAASLYRLGDLAGAMEESQLNYKSGIDLEDELASGINLDIWVRAADTPIPQHILAKELERPRHDAQGRAQVLFAGGVQSLRTGHPAAAAEQIGRAYEVAKAAGVRNAYTLPLLPWLATTLRQQAIHLQGQTPGRRDELLRRAEAAARTALRFRWLCKNDVPHSLRELGLLLAMRGEVGRARRCLDKSLTIARKQSARLEYAQTLLARVDLGEELGWTSARDDKAEAQAILGELHAYATPQQLSGQKFEKASLSLVDRFDAVLDCGRRIASALSPPVIQAEARNAALRLLRAEHCIVLRIIERDGETEFMPMAGSMPGTWNEAKMREALRARRAVAFSEDNSRRGADAAATGGKRSALCAPLYARGVAVACLYATHEHVRDLFGADDERLADYIVTIAGAALENAEGFAQLQALNETLERRVEERTAAVEARSQELARSNRELERVAQELRQAQAQLTVAKQAAEDASEAKSRFLAAMSHEIRTPLNAVTGMTELMLKSSPTPQQRNNLTIVKDSANALLTLLNDILDFSKIEAGRLDLECIPMSVRDVFGDAAQLMGVTAARKGLELTCHVDTSVPETLLGDPNRLRQVVMNLLGNAIKFTHRGEVFISVDVRQRDDSAVPLHVAVQDTGIGISSDKQHLIFEAFRQSDSSMTRRFGGTGLGLAISSQLVTLMGGRMWLESEPGRGSTFHFTVTLQVPATPAPKPAGWKLLPTRHVALVSASRHVRETYSAMLAEANLQVITLRPDSPRLDQLVRRELQEPTIDLFVVDVPAAEPEEIELVELVRSYGAEPPPVVALLPAVDQDLAERCRKLGAVHCLMKPVRTKDWEAVLRAMFDSRSDIPAAIQAAAAPPKPLRVLVVDDSPVNVEVAAGLLELSGHEAVRAGTGREALELCRREQFDLILMDLEMHDMDGLTATAAIREQEAPLGRHTPIIALTAHAIEGSQGRCLAAGMDGYISKPLNPDELLHLLADCSHSGAMAN